MVGLKIRVSGLLGTLLARLDEQPAPLSARELSNNPEHYRAVAGCIARERIRDRKLSTPPYHPASLKRIRTLTNRAQMRLRKVV